MARLHDLPNVPENRRIDAALEGGGALGAAFPGAFLAFARNGIWFRRVAGTSAGSVMAALIAAGYNANELEWLASNGDDTEKPESLKKFGGVESLRLSELLDFPDINELDVDTLRRTTIWRSIATGLAIAVLVDRLNDQVSVQLDTVADHLTQGVNEFLRSAGDNPVQVPAAVMRQALRASVGTTQIDVGLQLTTSVLELAADFLVKWLARKSPKFRLAVHTLYDTGFAKGDRIEELIDELIRYKVNGGNPGTVHFRDLEDTTQIDLYLVAVNEHTGAAELFSRHNPRTSNVPIAEAVRASMSIPLVYKAKSIDGLGTFIDGGLASNYPFWVFASDAVPGGMQVDSATWPARPNVGFILDETRAAPVRWNVGPPRFTEEPDLLKLATDQMPDLDGPVALPQGWSQELGSAAATLVDGAMLDRLFRLIAAFDSRARLPEQVGRQLMEKAVPDYHEVRLPVAGYHWLDFGVTDTPESYRGIAARAYNAALVEIAFGPILVQPPRAGPPVRAQPVPRSPPATRDHRRLTRAGLAHRWVGRHPTAWVGNCDTRGDAPDADRSATRSRLPSQPRWRHSAGQHRQLHARRHPRRGPCTPYSAPHTGQLRERTMGTETERKYLVKDTDWLTDRAGLHIRQGYLTEEKVERTVRVRVKGDTGELTVKGTNTGPTRLEWEYTIPVEDARAMLDTVALDPVIEKVRYTIEHMGLTWEVDVFAGANNGLVVAEVESPGPEDNPETWRPKHLPSWCGQDVTSVARYYNNQLMSHPYRDWPSRHRTNPNGTVDDPHPEPGPAQETPPPTPVMVVD